MQIKIILKVLYLYLHIALTDYNNCTVNLCHKKQIISNHVFK